MEITMNKLIGLALAATVSFGIPATAIARDGCGVNFHRGPAGRCRPNATRVVVRPAIGIFYPGRGYWDGRRYWKQRYRHHNGWRYR
jgi:hypothetical protein